MELIRSAFATDRLVDVTENSKLSSARFTRFKVAGKILRFGGTCLVVEIRHQIFRPVTNWSLIHRSHFNYLTVAIRSSDPFAKLLQAHLQLPERRVQPALYGTQR